MKVSLIAAMDKNCAIGMENQLPWHLPVDLKHFKQLTLDKPVIMGRKTFESIGRPLPKRQNIIVTRDKQFVADGCDVVNSLEEAMLCAKGADEVMVIGGATLYKQMLPQADCLYLTLVDHEVDGDAFFPKWDEGEWQEVASESVIADAQNPYSLKFVTLNRR